MTLFAAAAAAVRLAVVVALVLQRRATVAGTRDELRPRASGAEEDGRAVAAGCRKLHEFAEDQRSDSLIRPERSTYEHRRQYPSGEVALESVANWAFVDTR
jgi:hypothetical protein